MPNFAEPTTLTFIAVTVAVIFVMIAIGIAFVQISKKSKNIKDS